MKKRIDFTKAMRAAILTYLAAKQTKADAERAEKAAKAAAIEVFDLCGHAFKETEKSSYVYGMLQIKGEAKAVVYRETIKRGTVDWEAYAKALGGTDAGAELYRKSSITQTSLSWATTTQQKEINDYELCSK